MAIQDAPTVDVLKFDENEAYDHDRPISSLIRTQLLHLHHAEHVVVPSKSRTDININDLHTERQASEYIQTVTALLHKHGNKSKTKKRRPRKSAMLSARKPRVRKLSANQRRPNQR
jgi:hypothetical protein